MGSFQLGGVDLQDQSGARSGRQIESKEDGRRREPETVQARSGEDMWEGGSWRMWKKTDVKS